MEESWFIVADGLVFLCDAAGIPNGEGRKVEERGGAWTARQMLRDRRLQRPNEPYRGKLNYPPLKY
jgi:hypothetical protein